MVDPGGPPSTMAATMLYFPLSYPLGSWGTLWFSSITLPNAPIGPMDGEGADRETHPGNRWTG